MVSVPEYDLVAIGSGPAGQKCAIAGAKVGKRVAVVDRTTMIGGVCVHTGTIPSKTVREAIFLDGEDALWQRQIIVRRLERTPFLIRSRTAPTAAICS